MSRFLLRPIFPLGRINTPNTKHFATMATSPSAIDLTTTITTADVGGSTIKFGPFEVTRQVFLKTSHSFALVNLKPLIAGHVLVCPLKPHRFLADLSPAETADLFAAVQLTQRLLVQVHSSPAAPITSFTVAVQDGPEAGQTVPHVHVHVIPRAREDLPRPDDIYVGMAGEDGNVGGALWDRDAAAVGAAAGGRPLPGGGMPRIEDEDRLARTEADMHGEADRYRAVLGDMVSQ